MTDPLGQSQVIPYLAGLSKLDHEIFLISCEKKNSGSKEFKFIVELLKASNINWFPLSYTSKPPVISTLLDIRKINKSSKKIISKHKIEIVHCRSYIAALSGLKMKNKFESKFVFDMRGFYADERVDGGLWNIKNPIYKNIYLYFKKKEKQFLSNADYIISLTEKAKAEILKWELPNQPLPIQVIPCCADLELFNRVNIKEAIQKMWIEKLKILNSDFIISYLGSLGTWYMPDEMLDFFKVLCTKKENAKFLFITPDAPESIINKAKSKGIPENKLIIQKADRTEVPILLSLSKISIFFIKPVFSKRASSPTKMGEIMGMGIPLICNANVGDVDEIINATSAGIIVNSFNDKEYKRVVDEMDKLLLIAPEKIRHGAENYFSLKSGIEKYNWVYNSLKSELNE
jgi:hypothetical protein